MDYTLSLLLNDSECLRKLFFLLFYNGVIEGDYHFVFNTSEDRYDVLCLNVDDCEIKNLMLKYFEDNKNKINFDKFMFNLLKVELNEEFEYIVKKYK